MSEETFQAPDPEQLGELLPAYDFQSFIAQGGMGAVYKAVQRSLDRSVAIKILPREFGEDPEFRESFETEAKAMAKLNHPNLIGVHDYGQVDGMPYIVMENVDGKSLFHSASGKVIDPQEACRIVKGICDGLTHAHEAGVIHRDIKPANILLTGKAEPKIGDFGLAQAVDQKESGLAMGTPGYAAPELLGDSPLADQRTDIFAVGVILHELLTGENATGEHPPQTLTGDSKLDAIWRKATQRHQSQRYQSADEMSQALDDWMQAAQKSGGKNVFASAGGSPSSSSKGVPAASGQAANGQATSGQAASAGAAPPPGKKPENPKIMVKLVIILLLSVAIYFMWQKLQEYQEQKTKNAEREVQEDAKQSTRAPGDAQVGGARDPIPRANPNPLDPDAARGEIATEKLKFLNQRAKKFISERQAKRDEALEKNAKSLQFKLDTSLRSINNIDRKRIAPKVEEVKNAARGSRVPSVDDFTWDRENQYEVSLAGLVRNRHQKQEEIENDYRTGLTQLQDFYVKHLREAGREARKQEDEASIETLTKAIGVASGDTDEWLDAVRD